MRPLVRRVAVVLVVAAAGAGLAYAIRTLDRPRGTGAESPDRAPARDRAAGPERPPAPSGPSDRAGAAPGVSPALTTRLRVTDAATFEPLRGAVLLDLPPGTDPAAPPVLLGRSDEKGDLSFALPLGSQPTSAALLWAEGHEPSWPYSASPHGMQPPLPLPSTALLPTATVEGTVVDADRRPVEGVAVVSAPRPVVGARFSPRGDVEHAWLPGLSGQAWRARTDAAGRFRLPLAAQRGLLWAVDEGGGRAWVPANHEEARGAAIPAGGLYVLRRRAHVRWRFLDVATGRGVRGSVHLLARLEPPLAPERLGTPYATEDAPPSEVRGFLPPGVAQSRATVEARTWGYETLRTEAAVPAANGPDPVDVELRMAPIPPERWGTLRLRLAAAGRTLGLDDACGIEVRADAGKGASHRVDASPGAQSWVEVPVPAGPLTVAATPMTYADEAGRTTWLGAPETAVPLAVDAAPGKDTETSLAWAPVRRLTLTLRWPEGPRPSRLRIEGAWTAAEGRAKVETSVEGAPDVVVLRLRARRFDDLTLRGEGLEPASLVGVDLERYPSLEMEVPLRRR